MVHQEYDQQASNVFWGSLILLSTICWIALFALITN